MKTLLILTSIYSSTVSIGNLSQEIKSTSTTSQYVDSMPKCVEVGREYKRWDAIKNETRHYQCIPMN